MPKILKQKIYSFSWLLDTHLKNIINLSGLPVVFPEAALAAV